MPPKRKARTVGKRNTGAKPPKPAAETQQLEQLAEQLRQQEARIAELSRNPPPAPPESQLETLSVPSSPPREAEKIQYTITTGLRVNDGKIISGTLRNITEFTSETRAEMKGQVKYQQAEYSEHYGVEQQKWDENEVIQAFNGSLGQRLIADTLNPIENRMATKVSTMIRGRGRISEEVEDPSEYHRYMEI